MAGSGRAMLALGAIVVAAAAAAGLVVIGSPASERQRRIDERRVEALASLSRAVEVYRSRHGRLPDNLAALERGTGVELADRDPETGRPFEYRAVGDAEYELCASFARVSDTPDRAPDFWSHGPGRTCFRFTAEEVRPGGPAGRPWPRPGI